MTVERWQDWKGQLGKYVQDGLLQSNSVVVGTKAMDAA